MTLNGYQKRAFATAKIDWANPAERHVPVFGVIGELGSLASELKKKLRDGAAYTEGKANVAEEFGDLLWYVGALATHFGFSLGALARERIPPAACRTRFAHVYTMVSAFSNLAAQASRSLESPTPAGKYKLKQALAVALQSVLRAVRRERVDLDVVLKENLEKVIGMFGPGGERVARQFDRRFPAYERLPRRANIRFLERQRGSKRVEVILRYNDVNIGDRLTDNAATDDGYRYHDAFHLAYAAVLGWSPVVRATFRCKRKSNPEVDEVQDGARAVIIEEAIAQAVFHYAGGRSMLEDLNRVEPGILKMIHRMVRGLEVKDCAAHEWERAILVGFKAFRALKRAHGGWLELDAERQSLTFRRNAPIDERRRRAAPVDTVV